MRTTVDLPEQLIREVKATASRQGKTLKEYVREAVAEKLAQQDDPDRLADSQRE